MTTFPSTQARALASGKTQAPQVLVTGGVKASGTFTFGVNPSTGHTIAVNGVTLTFKASAANENEITIGANLGATLDNIRNVVDAHSVLAALVSSADNNSTVVTLTAKRPGVVGNAITLASGNANATPSGSTLTGGVDGWVDLKTKWTNLKPTSSSDQTFYMEDGEEGQEHWFYLSSKGVGNAVINANGTTLVTLDTDEQSLGVIFIDGDWRVMKKSVDLIE